MTERTGTEELDDAVDLMMADPHAPLPRMNPRLAALLRLAAELRDLPREAFKARLRAELLSVARGRGEPAAPAPSAGRRWRRRRTSAPGSRSWPASPGWSRTTSAPRWPISPR